MTTTVTCFSPFPSKWTTDALPVGHALGERVGDRGCFSALQILNLVHMGRNNPAPHSVEDEGVLSAGVMWADGEVLEADVEACAVR